jgi:hypothetical protein
MGPALLVPIFVAWAVTCGAVGVVFFRRAPAVSLALLGSVVRTVAGFLFGNADGPAEVPAYTAAGASVVLGANGLLGLSSRPLDHHRERSGARAVPPCELTQSTAEVDGPSSEEIERDQM